MRLPLFELAGVRSPLLILVGSGAAALIVVAGVAAGALDMDTRTGPDVEVRRTQDPDLTTSADVPTSPEESTSPEASTSSDESMPDRGAASRTGGASPDHTAGSEGPVFPVAGRDPGSIVGRFGDPRDGGLRPHLGIDIAAPRGTAVLAPAAGVIERVEYTRAGGRVIWLRQSAPDRLFYFAHLDTVLVQRGQRVQPGARIGAVGVSGNAVGTAPHLHLAVHEGRDILDPRVLFGPGGAAAGSRPDDTTPALMRRTRLNGAALRSAPGGGRTLAVLPRHQPVQILGRAGNYYRVEYRGRQGWLADWTLDTD